MIKNIIRPFSLLRTTKCLFNLPIQKLIYINRQQFAVKKQQSKEQNLGSIMIKNDNLKFQTEGFDLFFYPFHPQVVKKSSTLYEINKLSSVMALNFIAKSYGGQQSPQVSKANWENRKSIAFKFNQLAKLLEVNTKQSGKWIIEVNRSYKDKSTCKSLTFTNNLQTHQLDIILQETLDQGNSKKSQWKIQTKINHSEFQLFHFLLKESLYDLSGMKLMFDLRRNQQLAKMGEKYKGNIDKESLFRSYDNKDQIV